MSVSPRSQRTCALDLGTVRVGVAVDDDLGLLAHPRGTLDARNDRALLDALRAFADEEDVALSAFYSFEEERRWDLL